MAEARELARRMLGQKMSSTERADVRTQHLHKVAEFKAAMVKLVMKHEFAAAYYVRHFGTFQHVRILYGVSG